jgi:signal transduction histidine kinase
LSIGILKRLAPKSLIGQIALVMALALLVAQAINFGLVFNERLRATRSQIEGPAESRFIALAQRIAPLDPASREAQIPGRGRRGRYTLDSESAVVAPDSDSRIAGRLRDQAADAGLALSDARGLLSDEVHVPRRIRARIGPDERARFNERLRRFQTLHLSVRFTDGTWFNARLVIPRPDPWAAIRLASSTLLIYLVVLAAMIWVAARLTRPLKDLTRAATSYAGRGEMPCVRPRGPADLSRAIEAFNAMGARVGAMLDEKDRMLGAIGHDLRTPLASLRIRAESVEPAEERERMIATIEEMTAMLDDTLALARSGRAVEPLRSVDVSALADAVVEEFRALGHDVETITGPRQTAQIQPRLLRRAIRNVIDNAVKYAGRAEVAVRAEGPDIAVEVIDSGPGIPADQIERVQEAFYRIEPSRSRETGGTGLGLTLARAAVQAHGGRLELERRPEGGLIVRLLIPRENAEVRSAPENS